MKNKFFKKKRNRITIIIAIFVGLLFIGFYACRDEIEDSVWERTEAPKLIENAKVWYAENQLEPTLLRSTDGKQMSMKAEWSHAFATKHDSLEVVETDIISQGRLLFLNQECVDKYNETKDPKYMQSYTRIAFITNNKTGETVGCLMTVIPNLDWLEKSKFKPFMDVTYLFRSNQFGGTILFHNLDGSFSNGWKYEKGKIVASVSASDSGSDSIALRSSTTCVETCYELAYEYCFDVYAGSEDNQTYEYSGCDNVVLSSGCYTECINNGSSNGTYNNGGNGNSGASTAISSIAQNISLDSKGIEALNDILQMMLNQCGFSQMYSSLVSQNAKFSSVSINPSGTEGGYNSVTKALTFKDDNSILGAFPEEFVHMFQDYTYPGGIKGYMNTARNNIEFEAKLMVDILCVQSLGGCGELGAGKNYSTYYGLWLFDLLNTTGNRIPTVSDLMQTRSITANGQQLDCNYLTFLIDFNANNGNLGINSSLTPAGIQYLSSSSGC